MRLMKHGLILTRLDSHCPYSPVRKQIPAFLDPNRHYHSLLRRDTSLPLTVMSWVMNMKSNPTNSILPLLHLPQRIKS
jgi:hypothetical protein